jgi:hypothetical protein
MLFCWLAAIMLAEVAVERVAGVATSLDGGTMVAFIN